MLMLLYIFIIYWKLAWLIPKRLDQEEVELQVFIKIVTFLLEEKIFALQSVPKTNLTKHLVSLVYVI